MSERSEARYFPHFEYWRCLPKARGSGGDRAAPQLGACKNNDVIYVKQTNAKNTLKHTSNCILNNKTSL